MLLDGASAPAARVGRPVTDEIVSNIILRARLTAGLSYWGHVYNRHRKSTIQTNAISIGGQRSLTFLFVIWQFPFD